MKKPEPPPGAEILVINRKANYGEVYISGDGTVQANFKDKEDENKVIYMWCWIGAPTWYYLSEHPIPLQEAGELFK